MEKFPILTKTALDEPQRELWDELTLGPRGFYTGGAEATRLPELYNAWLQFPQFGLLMLQLAEQLRQQPELTGKYRELVILTVSVRLQARVEYDFHIPFARNEGLSEAVIAAIGAEQAPPFSDDGEHTIYDATVQLLATGTLSPGTRQDMIELVGHRGLMQLVAAISLYTVVAHTSNIAGVQLAEDFAADPQQLKDFFANR